MIYACTSRYCYFLFVGGAQATTCPDCGKKHIRPATRKERAAFIHHRSLALHERKCSG